MRKLLYIVSGLTVLSVFWSCSNSDDNSLRPQARDLYEKSVALNHKYTDSLLSAGDSAAILRLAAEYEKQLTHLNFEYPADTDLHMSEGENDTLMSITLRFAALRDSLLKHAGNQLPDSLQTATDSVGEAATKPKTR